MFVVTLSKASVKKLGVGAMCCALVNYKTEDGFCLGDWVRRMRENYACAEKKLTAERIAKLEALGMVWTVPQEG